MGLLLFHFLPLQNFSVKVLQDVDWPLLIYTYQNPVVKASPTCVTDLFSRHKSASFGFWFSTLALSRAQFEFAQRFSLGTSNILTTRFPWTRTLTNHMGVSDKGGPKVFTVSCFTDRIQSLIYWLAPLVWIRHPLYYSDWS